LIRLHQFAPAWDVPNLSPYCTKVETWLRMAGLEYEVANAIPPTAPKGKLPYITDGDETVADSRLILEYLKRRYRVDLDAGLSSDERATSLAFQRMIEDELVWTTIGSRWIMPRNWPENKRAIFGPVVRDGLALWARRRIKRQLRGQGLGLHSEEEVFRLGLEDLQALSDFMRLYSARGFIEEGRLHGAVSRGEERIDLIQMALHL
jgi:hypothetical protein